MTPRINEEYAIEHGIEDSSDLYGVTSPTGYNGWELFPEKELEYFYEKERKRKNQSKWRKLDETDNILW